MAEVGFFPPPPEVIEAMGALPNMKIGPTILGTQFGPDGGLGPEDAGAILVLHATFTDAGKARGFWEAAVPLMGLLPEAPGFLRRLTFSAPPSFYLIAFWRTAAHARAFAASPQHRAAVRALYAQRWQYSHFAALWELSSSHDRVIFCTECDGVTPASRGACEACGAPFDDVFRIAAPASSSPARVKRGPAGNFLGASIEA